MAAETEAARVYQLKVTLKYLDPPIWRRIQVDKDVTLYQLHQILQIVMGWGDEHLHEFTIAKKHYGLPSPFDEDWGGRKENEQEVTLSQVVTKAKAKFTYLYDFGDSWEHEIVLEKIIPPETGIHYPICLEGQFACPPDDCGGVTGYKDFLDAIRNPEHPDHEDMLEWIGGKFDPEEFRVLAVNRALASAFRATRRTRKPPAMAANADPG